MSSSYSIPAAEPLSNRIVDGAAVLSVLRQLVSSAEPAVVFTSLAAVCVPALSDDCRVGIEEDDAATYQISFPRPELSMAGASAPADLVWAGGSFDQRVGERWVSTPVLVDAVAGAPGYRGVVVHSWREGYRPGAVEAALAQAAVDHAIAVISQQRLTDQVQTLQRTASNLQVALSSNREIGAALGILMVTRRITLPEAFNLLRTASQHSHRKLRDVAEEVVFTGALDQRLTAKASAREPVLAAGAQLAMAPPR